MKCAVVCVAKIWPLTEKELGATIIIFTLKCGNNTFTMSSLRRYFRFQKHPHIKRAWTHNSSEELKQPEKKGNFFGVTVVLCCYLICCALTLRQKLFSKCGLVRISNRIVHTQLRMRVTEYENPIQHPWRLQRESMFWL